MPRHRKDGTANTPTVRRKLTDSYVRGLLPDEDRAYLVWDAQQTALAVAVQPTGHRSWLCVYRFNARPRSSRTLVRRRGQWR
jgi:hypothetical protein